MKKTNPKYTFVVEGYGNIWYVTLNIPYQYLEFYGAYTRRRDARRAALRAARQFGWDPMQFSIKYS